MLRLENMTIRFGGLIAVNELNFEIQKGQIFGLIGPNGAGKTTSFNGISGLIPPTSGKVIFKDHEIQGMPMYKINKLGIARTYQNINLFSKMTVLENVMVGRQSRTKCGLPSAIFRLPYQRQEEKEIIEKSEEILEYMRLTSRLKDKASSLSYGEQRRLEIARALASEPELILLDEPAAGMNPSEKVELMEMIRGIRDLGITVLIVEHDMKVVMGITDQICVVNFGKRIALGTPKEIQSNPEVIEAYLGGE